MSKKLAHIALLVPDYDEAIDYYIGKLNFHLVEDTPLSDSKRWVLISPDSGSECKILLAKAVNEEQRAAVGNQSGKRVFLFLHTDDFWLDYQNLQKHDVTIVRGPLEEAYGTVAVFKDVYGNLWDLIQPNRNQD